MNANKYIKISVKKISDSKLEHFKLILFYNETLSPLA